MSTRRQFLKTLAAVVGVASLGDTAVKMLTGLPGAPGSSIATDFTVSATQKAIKYTGSGGSYKVLELHRWLQDLADRECAMGSDDQLDITDPNPSVRQTDEIIEMVNGWTIDEECTRHLYGGAILSGGEVYASVATP